MKSHWRLFMACGWYGALGRVVNFEMCHLRSLGRVANFKNEAFRNGGIEFDFLASLTCCTCCRMIIRGVGVGGRCINVLDEHFSCIMEHVLYTLHMLSYDHQGGGGCITPLTSISLTLRNMLPLLTCCTCFLTRFCWISCVNLFWHQGFSPQKIQDGPSQPQTKYLY